MTDPIDIDALVAVNQVHWDDVVETFASDLRTLAQEVLEGKLSIAQQEITEIGDISGLRGIHLQCGTGLDTISLARLGADMVGIDISSRACAVATRTARQCGLDISFIQGNILDRQQLPVADFDFAYTSHGVLRWLPSLDRWAENIAALLRTGGWLYMYEVHPLVYHLQAVEGKRFILDGNYFDETVLQKKISSIHLGGAGGLHHRTVIHTNWTLSTIIRSLLAAGLQISTFAEHPWTSYSRKGLLPIKRNRLWQSSSPPPMPLAFSLRASRK